MKYPSMRFQMPAQKAIPGRKTFKLESLSYSMRYWNPEIETMSADLRSEMQSRKLRNMVRQAFNNSPFYRSFFHQNRLDPSDINTMSDLTKIPLTRKGDLVENPREFILQPNEISLTKTLPLEKRLRQAYDRFTFDEKIANELKHEYKPVMFVVSSGRSSGAPSPVFYTKYDLEIMAEIGGRIGVTAGMTDESFLHIAFSAGLNMAFWQCVEASEALGCMSIRHGTEKVLQQALILDRFGVSELAATPSFIDMLSREAEKMDLNYSKLKTIMAAGERFPPGMKKKIHSRFEKLGGDVRILEAYGSTEMKVAFVECEGGGFHIMPDTHFVEILDEKTLEPVGERERGVLAFTHIDFRGSVFLRFLTGDMFEGGMTNEPCECGRTTPRILGPIARMQDYGVNVKGNSINMNALEDTLAEVCDSYLLLVNKDTLTIRVGCQKGNLAKTLERQFSFKLDIIEEEEESLETEIAEKWKGRRVIFL